MISTETIRMKISYFDWLSYSHRCVRMMMNEKHWFDSVDLLVHITFIIRTSILWLWLWMIDGRLLLGRYVQILFNRLTNQIGSMWTNKRLSCSVEIFVFRSSIKKRRQQRKCFICRKSQMQMQQGGQSLVDRLLAAKNTIAGQALAKVVCKATTEEMLGPKRKHLDCTSKIDVFLSLLIRFILFKFLSKQQTKWMFQYLKSRIFSLNVHKTHLGSSV